MIEIYGIVGIETESNDSTFHLAKVGEEYISDLLAEFEGWTGELIFIPNYRKCPECREDKVAEYSTGWICQNCSWCRIK